MSILNSTSSDSNASRADAGLGHLTHENVALIGRLEKTAHSHRTLGERIADGVAAVVGSWTFLIIQSVLLTLWMLLNAIQFWHPWDPYPFVLLNLVLSFQAAFATPIILMSQNRQALLSERRNHLDLQINLLAEQENTEQLRLLRLLCEKAGIEAGEAKELDEPTRPEQIVEQIKQHVESACKVEKDK